MEERFERNAEAGGERGHDKSDKRSWRERLLDRFSRPQEAEQQDDESAERRVSFSEFIGGIFKRTSGDAETVNERSENWIDRMWDEREAEEAAEAPTDEERLSELPEHERTEFYMVVAQRFKDAGDRMMSFIRRNEQVPEPAEGPELHDVQPMYADVDEREAREFPPQLQHEAPPFDFALQGQEERNIPERNEQASPAPTRGLHRTREYRLPEPAPATERGAIDDFDFTPSDRNTDPEPRVSHHGEMTTVEYRPRVRDILFASAVGTAYGRSEARQAKQELERKQKKSERGLRRQLDENAKEFAAAQTRLREKQEKQQRELRELMQQEAAVVEQERVVVEREVAIDAAEQAQPERPVQTPDEVMQKVQEAAKSLFEPLEQQIPQDLQADPGQAAKRLAEAEATSFRELSFEELKPNKKYMEEPARTEIAREVPTPDNVFVRANPGEVPTKHVVENPFAEEVKRRQTITPAEQEKPTWEPEHFPPQMTPEAMREVVEPNPAMNEAVSVQEILSHRAPKTESKPGSSLKQQIAKQYDIETDRGSQNWAATAVILALILIGLLFVSAL